MKTADGIEWPEDEHGQYALWQRLGLEFLDLAGIEAQHDPERTVWPYGPPAFHQEGCRLFELEDTSAPGAFCDCLASARDGEGWGAGF